MNRKFILALMLASGMAFAQTGSSGSTPDQQQQPAQPAQPVPPLILQRTEQPAFNGHQQVTSRLP